ncbi:MAG TPA: DUF1583 domain-containing protein, partial [Isosphaeraceae bacterium]|nr:DUF1583 domain-containing protein [Isosphaeraceae bacterium]
ADLKQLLAEWSKKPDDNANPNVPQRPKDPWPSYLLVRACLADPKLAELGRQLAKHFPPFGWDSMLTAHLHRDTMASEVAREGGTPLASYQEPGLELWTPADHDTAAAHGTGELPSMWVSHEGHLSRVIGSMPGSLVFNVPLKGRFEISVDAYLNQTTSSHLGYSGVVLQPSAAGMNASWQNGRPVYRPSSMLGSVNGGDNLARAMLAVAGDAYNRLTIQVEPDKIRYLVNGHFFYEDKNPSPTSPWITLNASGFGASVSDFRKLTLKGSPQIPREVALSHADRLEGWIASFYGETMPFHYAAEQAGLLRRPVGRSPASATDERDWTSKDGVILGRRLDSADRSEPLQSRLYYHRPLRSGESLSYEFLYEPGAIEVHPALDRLVLLLDPSGVRLHWMTDGYENESTGLKRDNVAEEPANRRGPARLSLKPGEWNAVELRLQGTTLTLALNGETIYERPLEPANSRLFGLYHDKARTAARVRNVVLRGNWPQTLSADQLADLTAPRRGASSPADHRTGHALVGEGLLSRDAGQVMRQARALPVEKRYELLAGWVLPSDDHPIYRLVGDFTPTDPAPPVALPVVKIPAGATRVESGGELEAPALDLIAAAKDAGKLDELAERVQKAAASNDVDRRGQLALSALVRSAQGRDNEAEEALKAMKPLLEKVAPEDPEWQRWPELIAAAAALDRPELQAAARALLDYIVVEQLQKEHKGVSAAWKAHLVHVRGRAAWLELPESQRASFGSDPDLTAWARVTHTRSQTRGNGFPRPFWSSRDGELHHYPGHEHDYVYLRTPLRGDFELSCELFGWREVQLSYGCLLLGLGWDRKDFYVSHYGRQPRSFTLNPPLELGDKPFRFRLVIEAGSYTAYVNDRKIHEACLPSSPDPWLVLYQPGGHSGGVRNLTIKGHPTVPEHVELAGLPDLTGWFTDYDDDSAPRNADAQPWQKRGDEIVSQVLEDAAGSKQESLLVYHRPMLEDGEIQYEFYYEPGKTLTHPALGRLALLLQPDGVKVHWLTDAQHDRTGLAADNLQDEPANRRGPASLPLKPKDWNRLALRLHGDTISVRLNDELIYERPLEPTNQRTFGLFHYADETGVRVRNVIYRGQWPRKLPTDLGLGSAGQTEVSVNK